MTDLSIWQNAVFAEITAHIQQRYHDTHRQQFTDLIALSIKVHNAHEDEFPAQISTHLLAMQDELLNHMAKEERILFPMLNQGMGQAVSMPIRVMMQEHTGHNVAIAELLSMSQHLTAPEFACNSWRALYEGLRVLVDDLNEHMTLENEILFARALLA